MESLNRLTTNNLRGPAKPNGLCLDRFEPAGRTIWRHPKPQPIRPVLPSPLSCRTEPCAIAAAGHSACNGRATRPDGGNATSENRQRGCELPAKLSGSLWIPPVLGFAVGVFGVGYRGRVEFCGVSGWFSLVSQQRPAARGSRRNILRDQPLPRLPRRCFRITPHLC